MVTADHGENLGELGIYCDHQTADQHTTRLPFVLAWPGLDRPGPDRPGLDGVGSGEVRSPGLGPGAVDTGFHYQIDVMATVLELAGAEVPERWDGASFADALRSGRPTGRDHLVLSHGAWTAQRAVRFGEWICIRTYHDGFHGFPEVLLFDLEADPHEQHDVAADHPDVVEHALARLADWGSDALAHSATGVDPLWTVVVGGGPWHSRVDVPWYLDRLRATGRGRWADHFAAQGWPRPSDSARGVLGP